MKVTTSVIFFRRFTILECCIVNWLFLCVSEMISFPQSIHSAELAYIVLCSSPWMHTSPWWRVTTWVVFCRPVLMHLVQSEEGSVVFMQFGWCACCVKVTNQERSKSDHNIMGWFAQKGLTSLVTPSYSTGMVCLELVHMFINTNVCTTMMRLPTSVIIFRSVLQSSSGGICFDAFWWCLVLLCEGNPIRRGVEEWLPWQHHGKVRHLHHWVSQQQELPAIFLQWCHSTWHHHPRAYSLLWTQSFWRVHRHPRALGWILEVPFAKWCSLSPSSQHHQILQRRPEAGSPGWVLREVNVLMEYVVLMIITLLKSPAMGLGWWQMWVEEKNPQGKRVRCGCPVMSLFTFQDVAPSTSNALVCINLHFMLWYCLSKHRVSCWIKLKIQWLCFPYLR